MLRIKSERAAVWLQGISCTNKPLGPISLCSQSKRDQISSFDLGGVIKSHLSHHCELSLHTL